MNRSPTEHRLFLVADNAGSSQTDKAINKLVDQTGVPLTADFRMSQPGAMGLGQAMLRSDLISLGLQFDLPGYSQEDVAAIVASLPPGARLTEQGKIRGSARGSGIADQLKEFQDAFGKNPSHLSTRDHFETDPSGHLQKWWVDRLKELFDGGNLPPMRYDHPTIPHPMPAWAQVAMSDANPEHFAHELHKLHGQPAVEFMVHPGHPDAESGMRVKAAIAIIQSGVIEQAGFRIASITELTERKEDSAAA